ncbi:MAG: hypothetical protein Q7U26_02335 [Aquabacterium sp.]|nr:hypothetical protein [Aquabacterium sp.]
MTQGQPWFWRRPWRPALWLLVLAMPSMGFAACPGPALRVLPLAPGWWWVPAAPGESDGLNRGQVSNIVLARQGQGRAARLWALGSGPSPAWGRALACQVRVRLGLSITDVISPWARPELVLGVAGLRPSGPVRHWAHASVAQAMDQQCPHCVERLRERLQGAASDLGDDPIDLPERLLQGERGRLGPFDWWRLPRAEGRWITVWRLRPAASGAPRGPLWVAHGLLQGEGPADGRDADLALLLQASQRLATLAAADGPAARFIGEQGPVMGADAPARQAAYWSGLLDEARAAVARGDDEAAPAPAWPGLPAGWQAHPWHGFNWQRAWRQVEPEVLAAPPR